MSGFFSIAETAMMAVNRYRLRLRAQRGVRGAKLVLGLLGILHLQPTAEPETALSPEEVRTLVLEGHYFRGKHRAMLANLFDLDSISVDDVMTPRNHIEALDLSIKPSLLAQQLATS